MGEQPKQSPFALTPDELYRACDPASLGFDTTAELNALGGTVGQGDALAALEFGVSVVAPGYNVFVLGAPGSGRMTMVRRALAARARELPTPEDWCYVANFGDARRPRALQLPPGRGPALAAEVAELIADLRDRIPRALEAEAVAARRVALVEEQERAAATVVEELQAELAPDPFVALVGTPDALMVVPARGHEPLERPAYAALSPELQGEVDEHVQAARHRVFAAHRRIHEFAREARDQVADLNREVSQGIIVHRVAAVNERYAGLERVQGYLDELAADVLAHLDEFLPHEEPDGPARAMAARAREDFFSRYVVRVLLSHDPADHAPVVHEVNPTVGNLFGHVERQLELGVLTTDFTRITAGALHRANGGFLLLDAGDVLARALAWPALKRALQLRRITPAEGSELAFLAMETLDPEPVPLDVKVVLVGEPQLYYALQAMDREFVELFKVKSDFAPDVPRTPEAERGYADFIASRCVERALPPFEAAAAARIIEEGSRRAGDQRRLTARMRDIADILTEAAHFARAAGRETVDAEALERALAERDRRDRRPEREILELIGRGMLRFEPRGEAVGQLHGIGLLSLGELMFGRPIRVMASAYMGTSGVVNLEREASMSGPIHTKGFLILSGYLGRLFARTQPLILSGTLSFEQMYEEVEGDSASAAELFALVSAIAGVPLRQDIGVTGALNPEGRILPVGGVTAKIEGFFAACQMVGLTGEQGVLLPRRNVENLVLHGDVRDAVAEGRFHVWAIDRVEDGWPILSGREAGEEVLPGHFTPGSVHEAAMEQLATWAEEWKGLGERARAGEG